tara:strand:- start:61 stop:240 length:180 start_codon:yes stop_codon:yes gene_type:complete
MKITRKQLRRIIRENHHNEELYSAVKERVDQLWYELERDTGASSREVLQMLKEYINSQR